MDISSEEGQAFSLRQELVEYLKNQGLIRTPQVERAFREVPRHLFLPGVELQKVYSDTYVATKLENDVPISSSSQPAIMAYMLEELELEPGQRVLEVGAGTGYNAALMAHIVGETGQVITIDIDVDIVEAARAHLQAAGFSRVQVLCSDGSTGYSDLAPYDRIILTVSADDITPAWRDQLRQGDYMVLPFKFTQFRSLLSFPNVLPPSTDQVVLKLRKTGDHLESVSMRGAGFMPLRGIFAVQTERIISLDSERELTLACQQDCAAQEIAGQLQGSYNDLYTGISGTYTDFWGLRTWLTLREPAYCELLGKGDDKKREYGALPSIAQIPDGSIAAYGLCAGDSISLFLRTRAENAGENDYWLQPFELIIRSFGPQRSLLAQQLFSAAQAWHEAGRPFYWHSWDILQNIRIRVYPLESSYGPGPHELLSERKGSRFVFAW